MRDRNDDWSAWLRAGIAGDEAAYGRFLREVTPHLRTIARAGLSRAGRSTAEAEDVVQDALIAIHTKRTSWIPTEPVVPWLRAILKHKLIDTLRKRGSHGHIDIDEFAEAIAAPSSEPEIATRDVMKLAAGLPSGQKAVIEAMFVDGHNTAETAAALKMSEGAVRVALHRALGGLAKMLRGVSETMKTDDLINALSRDATLTEPPVGRRLSLALVVSAALAFALLMIVIKPRPDLMVAATTMLFDLKMLLIATLAVAAVALLNAVARPEGRLPRMVLVLPLALLIFGIGHELATQAPANYGPRLVGRNWAFCLVSIPLMAIGPLALIMTAMRASAPSNAAQAGAIAGFAAGVVAGFFYGIHCIDDSPLFVVTWYTIAIGLMSVLGAAIGRRVLAW